MKLAGDDKTGINALATSKEIAKHPRQVAACHGKLTKPEIASARMD